MLACMAEAADIVSLLLERSDVWVNAGDLFGATALMYAAQQTDQRCLQYLLDRRELDLDEEDCDHRTAEDYARDAGFQKNVKLIRQARLARIRGSYAEPEPDSEEDQQHKSIVEQHHSRIFDKKENLELLGASSSEEQEEEEGDVEESPQGENEGAEGISPIYNHLERQCSESFSGEVDRLQNRLAELRIKFEGDCESVRLEYEEEKEKVETELQERLSNLQKEKTAKQSELEASFNKQKKNIEASIQKLNLCMDQFDWEKFLRISNSASELECPVCIEEMRPPMKIWQCKEGHPICDVCRRRPQVSSCPVCRQDIVGRNILAEKIAATIFI